MFPPALALCAGAVALLALRHGVALRGMGPALTSVLAASAAVTSMCPIYVRHQTKAILNSIPLFLLATLLPPDLAGVGALIGVLGGELAAQPRTGLYLSDMLTTAARYTLAVLAASAFAHVDRVPEDIGLLGAALVLWTGDILTSPLSLSPISGERPLRVMIESAREGGAIEATQYVIGIIAVLLLRHVAWPLATLPVLAVLVYIGFKREPGGDALALLSDMADTVDARVSWLAGHSRRVQGLVEGMMRELHMHGQEARHIIAAARLHDIGMVHVPADIMERGDPRTPEERALVGEIPRRGADLLASHPDFSRSIPMVRHISERWDGSGPDGLRQTDIPFGARVIAIADAYDHLTIERPGRPALTPYDAMRALETGRGRDWDPQLLDAFARSIGLRPLPAARPAESGERARA